MSYLDNFIYGFSIPQISKEFDLLKIYENGPVINIELKSRMIDEKKIEYQLKKNQYYLSHFKKEIISFTYVMTETGSKVFSYDGVSLKESNISEILFSICQDGECYHKDIETLFRAKDYLISPINTPNLFIDGNYYLTDQQENIKNEMDRGVYEVDHAMNWDEEIQNLVRDIQMEAVIIELCRLAVDKQSPTLAEFSSQFFRGSGTFQFLLGTAEP